MRMNPAPSSGKWREVIIDFTNDNQSQCTCNHNPCRCGARAGRRAEDRLLFLEKQRQYYCTCKIGARSSNPCAHITALLTFIYFVRSNKLSGVLSAPSISYASFEPMNCYRHELWREEQHTLVANDDDHKQIELPDDDNKDNDDNHDDRVSNNRSSRSAAPPPVSQRRGAVRIVGGGSAVQGQSAPQSGDNSTGNENNMSAVQPIAASESGAADGSSGEESDNDVVGDIDGAAGTTNDGSNVNRNRLDNMDMNVGSDNGQRRRYPVRSTRERNPRYQGEWF